MASGIPRIVAMPDASLIGDGADVRLEFQTSDGEALSLEFSAAGLGRFVATIRALLRRASLPQPSEGEYEIVDAWDATKFRASPAELGQKVVFVFQTEDSLEYGFAVSVEAIPDVQREIAEAEQVCKTHGQPSLH